MRANFSYGKKDMNLTGVGGGVGLVGGRAGRMGGGAVGDSLMGGGGGQHFWFLAFLLACNFLSLHTCIRKYKYDRFQFTQL